MSQTQKGQIQQAEIERPVCPRCGALMWLAYVSPDGPGKEFRTFDCPVCEISTGESEHAKRGIPIEI